MLKWQNTNVSFIMKFLLKEKKIFSLLDLIVRFTCIIINQFVFTPTVLLNVTRRYRNFL